MGKCIRLGRGPLKGDVFDSILAQSPKVVREGVDKKLCVSGDPSLYLLSELRSWFY
jgi:hypothetical protein